MIFYFINSQRWRRCFHPVHSYFKSLLAVFTFTFQNLKRKTLPLASVRRSELSLDVARLEACCLHKVLPRSLRNVQCLLRGQRPQYTGRSTHISLYIDFQCRISKHRIIYIQGLINYYYEPSLFYRSIGASL